MIYCRHSYLSNTGVINSMNNCCISFRCASSWSQVSHMLYACFSGRLTGTTGSSVILLVNACDFSAITSARRTQNDQPEFESWWLKWAVWECDWKVGSTFKAFIKQTLKKIKSQISHFYELWTSHIQGCNTFHINLICLPLHELHSSVVSLLFIYCSSEWWLVQTGIISHLTKPV